MKFLYFFTLGFNAFVKLAISSHSFYEEIDNFSF
jgi:hypothetical protein